MYIVSVYNDGEKTDIQNHTRKLRNGKIVAGINTIDSFTFSVFPFDVGYELLREYKTLVSVYNTNKKRYEFQGRVLVTQDGMTDNGIITREITCESYLGFLCDSRQGYVEERNWGVSELLKYLINTHNSQVEEEKRFTVRTVSVTDPNNNLYCGIQRENTFDSIKTKLIDKLGGEIRYEVGEDTIYLDYLPKIGERKLTPIELSVNLKSITREKDPTAIITRLIPLGAKQGEGEERLEISANGKNYIDDEEAKEKYGIHVGYVEFDDVTDTENLYRKGEKWLEENNKIQIKYTVTALDLSLIKKDYDDFCVGNDHSLKNPLMGIDERLRIVKKNIDVCEETKSTFEIGDNFKSLSDIQKDNYIKLKESTETDISKLHTELNNKASTSYVDNQIAEVEKIPGADGESAYDIWLKQGNTGSEADFLQSLQGPQGERGTGVNVKSSINDCKEIGDAYIDSDGNIQIVTSLTPLVFTNGGQVKGPKGDPGKNGVDGKTPYIQNGNWYINGTNTGVKAEGKDGYTPVKGVDYFDGKDGKDVDPETLARIESDIDGLKTADGTLNSKIEAETTAREHADSSLSGRIDAEKDARLQDDSALGGRIDAETSARTAADNALSGRIDSTNASIATEKTQREQADNAEKAERENADNALNTRIEEESTERENADNAINQEIGGIKNTLNEKADKTELDGKLDKTEFEETTSEAVGLIQGDINHLGERVDGLESELDNKADKTELDNKVNKEDLAPIIITPSSTFDECYNAYIQAGNYGRMVIYEVGNGVSVTMAIMDAGSEGEPAIAGGYYHKDGKVYYCGVKVNFELMTVEHFNEEVTTNTGSGQIIIEVKNINVEDSEDFELLGTGTITAEQSQQIIDNFSKTVLFSQELGLYAHPSMVVDGGYVYKAQAAFYSWNAVMTVLVDTATNVVTAIVPHEEDRIIELTNIAETGSGTDAYTATITLDDLALIRSDFNGTKLRAGINDFEMIFMPHIKSEELGTAVYIYSATISNMVVSAKITALNSEISVVITTQTLIDTEDLKQQNVINENTFASKDYVDEKIEQIETVKGDKGDKGDTGRGIASIMQSGATFIVIYTDGTRQEIVMEQDYQFNWQVEENGLKVEGILPPGFELEITEGFDGMELTGVAVGGFYGQGGLVKVTIDVPYISQEAFYDCETLNDVTLTNKVTGIGENAFGGSTPAGTSGCPIKVLSYSHLQNRVTINRYAFGYESDGSPRKGYFIDETGDIGEWNGERINWNY